MNNLVKISLSRAAAFSLGPMLVEPSIRQVTGLRGAETIEPRVLQVLVALVAAHGSTVNRDELLHQCWNGQVVSDSAIHRVIARLRRLADEQGAGSFHIDTVPRVGYRLVGEPVFLVAAERPSVPVEQWPPIADGELEEADTTVAGSAEYTHPVAPIRRGRLLARWWLVGGAALAIAIVIVIAIGLGVTQRSSLAKAVDRAVVVDTFALSGAELPTSYAADLRSEIFANRIRARPVITVLAGNPVRYPSAFRLTGRVWATDGKLLVVPALFAPGYDDPVWSKKYALPLSEAAQPQVAQRLMTTVACIINGAAPTAKRAGLNHAAMEPWAEFCDDDGLMFDSPRTPIDALRRTVAADPGFGPGWVEIASTLGPKAWYAPPVEAAAMRAEGRQAVATALRIDPGDADAYGTLALLTTATDFLGREAIFKTAMHRARGDADQQYVNYGNFLTSVGRVEDTIAVHRRSRQLLPQLLGVDWAFAEALATTGETGQAQRLLEDLEPQLGDRADLDELQLQIAMWTGDWRRARMALSKLADSQTTRAMRSLIDALAVRNTTGATAAGELFVALANGPRPVTGLTILGLAMSGKDRQAVNAAVREYRQWGPWGLRYLYQPPFAHARTSPEFAAMVERLGLVNYWRKSGNLPDFCKTADAPALCIGLMAREHNRSAPVLDRSTK